MRETIEIETEEELRYIYREGKNKYFKFIEEEVVYIDLSKSYKNIEFVIQRSFDDKFFKIEITEDQFGDLQYNNFPIIGTEVFPETLTKVIYK